MKMRGIPGGFGPPAGAAPCGLEERIAAVYDRGAVAEALDRKHIVAFFAIDGVLATNTRRAIEAIAESAFGVDKGSARVSVETASLSLAFDPKRVAFEAIQNILDRKLATIRLTLLPMRIVDDPDCVRGTDGARSA